MTKNGVLIALSFVFLSLFSIGLKAQDSTATKDPWKTLPHFKSLPQEKVYLHFDKPYYVAGDRMWFRAYLVNAETHKPDTASCAIYVELINSRDSLVKRMKIRDKNGVYDGAISLDETMPEGVYSVRAYTNWMRNAGPDYFYHRQFFVGNSISSQIQSSIQYTFYDNKRVGADIKFQLKNAPLASKKINYYLNLTGQPKTVKTFTTNTEGVIHIEYNPQLIEIKKPLVGVSFQENLSKYERTYILPAKADYDVQFLPEGGGLVSGTPNCVAFKAIQSDGFSTEVSGSVFDNTDVKICDFKSTNLGMGRFYFLPDNTKTYYALVKSLVGETKKIELPQLKQNSSLLSVTLRNKKIYVAIKSNTSIDIKDSLILLGHSRGAIFFQTRISNASKIYTFDQKELRSGIINFLLINKKGEPVSERLVFVKPDKTPEISLNFDKKDYDAREKVTCLVKVVDAKGNPIQGSFSVAATDASDVQLDASAENIVNTLLLSSDLKGYIEKPNEYFNPSFKQADEALDVLMMTQGWKRFDIGKLLKGEKEKADNFLEAGQAITGTIATGLLNKREKGTKVSIIAPSIKYFGLQETDETGRFSFSGFMFPDSTLFNIQAKRKHGLKDAVEIRIDQDTFPPIEETIVRPETATTVSDNYLESASQKFFYENGILNMNLRGVEITTDREKDKGIVTDPIYFYSHEDFTLQGEALERFADSPVSRLIHSLPGMQKWSENISNVDNEDLTYSNTESNTSNNKYNPLSEAGTGPQFASEGNFYTYAEIQGLDVKNLYSVQILKPSAGTSNTMDDMLIVFNFKKGYSISSSSLPPRVASAMPLGFAKDVVFYQPKYEVESVKNNKTPDWRSTICWQPELKTDASGIGKFTFYTADRPSKYNLVIEGVSPSGEACRIEEQEMLFSKEKK